MREKLLKSIRQFTLSPELRRSRSLRITIYVVLSTLLYLLFIGNVLPERYNYVIGSVAEKTIKAPTDATDSLATKRVRDDARKKVGPQYNKDIEVEERAYATINTFFDAARRVSESSALEADKLAEMKKLNIPIAVDDAGLRTVIAASPDAQNKMRKEATRAVQTIYNGDIDEQQMAKVDERIDAQLAYVDLDKEQRVVVKNLVRPLIQPNMIYDKEATDKKREEAAASVLPVVINKGEIIVKQGERIDEEAYNKLKDLRLTQEEPNYRMYFGFAGFIALWMLVLIVYLELTGSKIGHNNLLLVCLSMIVVLVAVFTKTVTYGEPLGFANIGYLTPAAMGTMLVTILFDTQLGILLSFLFALLTGAAFDMSFQHVFISFVSGLTGAFAVSRVKHRMVIMRAGFIIAGINLVTIATTMALSTTGNDIAQVMQSLLFGIISGLFSAVVTIGFLPFLESSFGLLTPISLLELSNPNHPLLKKLLMEAPGTYHHSLIVGNLAEAAA